MFLNWLSHTKTRKHEATARRQSGRPMRLESLEKRSLLAALLVSSDDPGAFAEIQDAVDAAEPGDTIKVAAGTYLPFEVNTDGLIIREATRRSNPVIDATGFDVGVALNANGVTLRGLTVENAEQQGFLVTGDGNTLRDNTARNIVPPSTPFPPPPPPPPPPPSSSQATDENAPPPPPPPPPPFGGGSVPGGDGFVLVDADNNRLIGNFAESNDNNGFVLRDDSDGNILRRNTAQDNPTGFNVGGNRPIVGAPFAPPPFGPSFETSDGNTLRGNKATGYETGFYVSGKTELVPSDNGFSLVTTPVSDTTLQFNSAFDPAAPPPPIPGQPPRPPLPDGSPFFKTVGYGVRDTEDTTLVSNFTTNNLWHGFDVSQSEGATIRRNLSINNDGIGFSFVSLNASDVIGNSSISNDRDGFVLSTGQFISSSDNLLKRNLALNNTGDGFRLTSVASTQVDLSTGEQFLERFLQDINNNTLKDNTAIRNGGSGFNLVGVSGNVLRDNDAKRNGGDGFRIAALDVIASERSANADELLGSLESDDNLLVDNQAEDNGGYGFFVDQILSNFFDDNESEDNALGASNLDGIVDDD